MTTAWVEVVEWKKFQHYKDRDPPWIKLHRQTLDNYEWSRLQDASKAHLVGLWLLAGRHHNHIPADPEWIGKRISSTTPVDLQPLVDAGFILLHAERKQDASGALAKRSTEAEGETEVETTTPTTRGRAREEQPEQVVQHEAEPERESGIGNRESERPEGPSRPPPGSADARLIAKFDFDAAQLVADFLGELGDHPKRAAVIGFVGMWASGHSMPPAEKATPDEIASGLTAYRAANLPIENRDYADRHIWGFIRSIVLRRTNPAPARASPNSSRERSPPDKARKPSHVPSLRSE